jgi:cytochrome c553
MKLRRMIAVVAVLGLLGAIALVAGAAPIKASAGHWAITKWFLQFAKQRSVAMRARAIELPRLDDPGLILKGAGHFEIGCRPCHGSPESPPPRIARAMLPPPPPLAPRVKAMTPEQLFYIVKHGLKFTGMPAWIAQDRDDEVHAVVAFLLELPKLDAAGYRHLARGVAVTATAGPALEALDPARRPPAPVLSSCARCHGVDGLGRGPGAFPKLAGQSRGYLLAALDAYARDARKSGMMQAVAAALAPGERELAATFYADLTIVEGAVDPARRDSTAVARGEAIAKNGIPGQDVPSCADCHGPGQYADYLVLQLELIRSGRRGGSGYAHIMAEIAPKLTPAQVRDVAAYYESLANSPLPAGD